MKTSHPEIENLYATETQTSSIRNYCNLFTHHRLRRIRKKTVLDTQNNFKVLKSKSLLLPAC